MPLRLEIKRELSARSERVKCVDIHLTEPWVLAALFSGNVVIWNYTTETSVKTFECCDVPVRSAKFISRKHWVICAADDMSIRIYNYNTMEKIKTFEAHSDYIRDLAVHPTLPYVLSASDDMSIKMWDWDKDWVNAQVFEGHTHYVMQVEINPKDPTTFASASLDHSLKVWGLGSRTPHFSLEGHSRGVNCVSYFHGGDRPYLISGADDQLIKIWDYQTKSCVGTLEGHCNNVSAVLFHPVLPLIISGSEDGTVRLWHSTTFRLENTLNYGLERVWSISCHKDSNKVAFGYDEGTIMIKIGHEEPVVSMDRNGKVVWAKNHDIIGTNVKTISSKATIADGERLPLATKEMGSCEIYPQEISHDPKARLLAVCGDGEYIVYTALVLKNKCFGPALEFVWASHSGMFATRESTSKVKIFKNFLEHTSFRPPFSVEGIFGGTLLGMRSHDFVDFYDWETCSIIRRVEVCPRLVFWSETNELVVVATESSYFALRYNSELVGKYICQSIKVGEQGIDGAFELEQETGEHIITGEFVGDCFIYTNAANRLNYCVGGEVITLAHLDKPYYLLGYLPKEDRVYLIDKHHTIVSFSLLLSILIYETAIVRNDFEAANSVLESIPKDHHDRLARFLDGQGLHQMALEVTTDPEHQFELAIQLNNLRLAHELCIAEPSDSKWRSLGDSALTSSNLLLAKQCFTKSKDCGGLLLMVTSVGDRNGLENLVDLSKEVCQYNVTFIALFLLGRIVECLELLIETGRISEAAIMAKSYAPSEVPRLVELWRQDLKTTSIVAGESLASPENNPDMFPDHESSCLAESFLSNEWGKVIPSDHYLAESAMRRKRDVLEMAKNGELHLTKAIRSPSVHIPSHPTSPDFPRTASPPCSVASSLNHVSRSSSSRSRSPARVQTDAPMSPGEPVYSFPGELTAEPTRGESPTQEAPLAALPNLIPSPKQESPSELFDFSSMIEGILPAAEHSVVELVAPITDSEDLMAQLPAAESPAAERPAAERPVAEPVSPLLHNEDWMEGLSANGGLDVLDEDQFDEFLADSGPISGDNIDTADLEEFDF